MYYNLDQDRREAELGISIGERDYWENGYGTDALKALTTALFRAGEIQRFYLHTLDWNTRAQRAFQKAGFQECGVSWRDGRSFVVMDLRAASFTRTPAHALA
jgi:RimJ/RimL family protein N-acetyltransferase